MHGEDTNPQFLGHAEYGLSTISVIDLKIGLTASAD